MYGGPLCYPVSRGTPLFSQAVERGRVTTAEKKDGNTDGLLELKKDKGGIGGRGARAEKGVNGIGVGEAKGEGPLAIEMHSITVTDKDHDSRNVGIITEERKQQVYKSGGAGEDTVEVSGMQTGRERDTKGISINSTTGTSRISSRTGGSLTSDKRKKKPWLNDKTTSVQLSAEAAGLVEQTQSDDTTDEFDSELEAKVDEEGKLILPQKVRLRRCSCFYPIHTSDNHLCPFVCSRLYNNVLIYLLILVCICPF